MTTDDDNGVPTMRENRLPFDLINEARVYTFIFFFHCSFLLLLLHNFVHLPSLLSFLTLTTSNFINIMVSFIPSCCFLVVVVVLWRSHRAQNAECGAIHAAFNFQEYRARERE